MQQRILRAGLAATVLFIASVAGASAVPFRGAHATRFCGYVHAHWSTGGHSGSQYTVTANGGVSCSFARHWSPRLIKEHPTGASGFIASPKGWTCQTLPSKSNVSYGGCDQKGKTVGHTFNWAPKQV